MTSIITQILESSNRKEIFREMWSTLDVQAIPALIYVATTSEDEEEKDSACAVLMKFFLSPDENKTPTTAPIVIYPIEAGNESTQRRTIIKVPKKQVVSSKSITYAFHMFATQCHTFPSPVLIDTLKILPKYFEIKEFALSPRLLLDMLTFVPLLFDVEHKRDAYDLIELIRKEAEKRCLVDVIIAVNSLLTLFPFQP